ncbi:TnsA endonuclease N-terminal domain-containing protein [Kitasatospora sp. NPDC096140]|uniref:TnsA endonuclease N-terminal domain-containing protein n=1 Tax=Kitasatospora sp. NPDC096140 TaxID=3155425 RepID=UPI00331C694D
MWSDAEDARLLELARQGLDLDELAVRHGRSVGAIRGRLTRHMPLAFAMDEDLLRWARSLPPPADDAHSLDADADTDPWTDTGNDTWTTADTDTSAATGTDCEAPDPAEVLAEWQQLTGYTLGPERQAAFLARSTVGRLAAEDPTVRRDAGRRLWRGTGRLLLDDWALECRCPGAATLAPPWSAIAEDDDDTAMLLRELLAAAVEEIPGARDRRIVASRFGVGDQDARTQERIGADHGLSRERIRQLQNRAVRAMARSAAPATGRLRTLVAELGGLDGHSPDAGGTNDAGGPNGTEEMNSPECPGTADGPSSAERLLDLAQVLVPSMAPRQAVTLLATLAGARKLPADNLAAQAMTIRTLRHDAQRREATRQGRIERATARWERLAGRIEWFGIPESAPPRSDLSALREADDDDPRSGSWHCPKLGRAVAYESESELHLIQLLSFAPQIAYYQEQPLAIGYEFDGRPRTYFPDLLVATTDGRCILVEVKPLFEMATAVNVAKYRALAQLCRERGWGLLVTDGHRTRALLEEHRPDPGLGGLIGPLLDDGTVLGWPHVVAAAGGERPHWMDFAALVLSRGWDWRTRPFRLSIGRATAPPATSAPATPPATAAAVAVDQDAAGQDAVLCPTPEEIEAARTPAGGWRRDQLAAWGVPWPPPRGWKQRLTDRSRAARG